MISIITEQMIYQMALNCGYDNCGIVPLAALNGYAAQLAERKEKVPQSTKFYQTIDGFTKLHEQYPWGKSVIICTTWLGKYKYPKALQGKYAKAFFLSSESAPDSIEHQNKLKFETWLSTNGIQFEGGEKYGPIRNLPLRYAAVQAGLGIFRKNNFFYTEKGSYVQLEGYIIDQEMELTHTCPIKPCPTGCTLCQKACKTHALSAPYTMNPTACVSFWTTYGQGHIPPNLEEAQFETWICGCDACQDACPYNKHDWNKGEDFPGLNDIISLVQPENILKSSDEELAQIVIPKTTAHILPSQINTLRTTAARALRQMGKNTTK